MRFLLIFFVLISLYTRGQTCSFSNDSIQFTYKLKKKSDRNFELFIKKKNLLKDTIVTYGFIDKKSIIEDINKMKIDSIFDWHLHYKSLYEQNIFIEHYSLPLVIMPPGHTEKLKLEIYSETPIGKIYLMDRFLFFNKIPLKDGKKKVDTQKLNIDLNVYRTFLIPLY